MLSNRLYKIILLVGIVLELLTLTFLKGDRYMYISPILWILAGFFTVGAAIPLLVFAKPNQFQIADNQLDSSRIFTVLGFLGLFSLLVAFIITKQFHAHPYNPLESDVIPTIEILVRRLLNGEWVYAPIDFPGWTVHNAYLPLQYMPFVIAEKLHFDYRWLAYLFFVVTLFFWIKKVFLKNSQTKELVLKIIAIFIALLILNKQDWASLAFSLELIDVAFYLFLALSFFHKDWKIKSLAILCCLLSRYAFTFWLPFYAISYWIEYGKKDALKIVASVFLGIVVLYVLPFLTKQPMLFFDGLKYYDKTAIGQWSDIPSWYQHVGKPFHLSQGQSTAIYFYDFWNGDISTKLNAARLFHLLACIFSVIVISFCYHNWKKHNSFDYSSFLLLSLKFYFVFFYGFFYVPFSYLYWIPLFFTLAILFKVSFSEK